MQIIIIFISFATNTQQLPKYFFLYIFCHIHLISHHSFINTARAKCRSHCLLCSDNIPWLGRWRNWSIQRPELCVQPLSKCPCCYLSMPTIGIFLILKIFSWREYYIIVATYPYINIWANCCMLANQPERMSLFLVTSSSCTGPSSCASAMKF